jgi:hypothetical protein
MPTYTVHEPPRRNDTDDTLAHTSRFVFVRDGFHWWAFLLTPLWLLRRWLWLEFIVYVLIVGGATFVLGRLGIQQSAGFIVSTLLSLLIGMEASTLRRWKLGRKGYENLGIVVGDDQELAERRFFDSWTGTGALPPARLSAAPSPPAMTRAHSATSSDIVGLFPQPGARA